MVQAAFPEQLALVVHCAQVPAWQYPLLQSALVLQGAVLLTRQRFNWHMPPAQSLFAWQGAPPGALQVDATHIDDLHWLLALQAVQTKPEPGFEHRPLPHATSSVQEPLS